MPNPAKKLFSHPTVKRVKRVASDQLRKVYPKTGKYQITKPKKIEPKPKSIVPEWLWEQVRYEEAMAAHGFDVQPVYSGRRRSLGYLPSSADPQQQQYYSFQGVLPVEEDYSMSMEDISELVRSGRAPPEMIPMTAVNPPDTYYPPERTEPAVYKRVGPSVVTQAMMLPYQSPTKVFVPKKPRRSLGIGSALSRQFRRAFPQRGFYEVNKYDGRTRIPEWLIKQIRMEEAMAKYGLEDRPYAGKRHSLEFIPQSYPQEPRAYQTFQDHMPYEDDDYSISMENISELISGPISPEPIRKTEPGVYHRVGPSVVTQAMMLPYQTPKKVFVPKRPSFMARHGPKLRRAKELASKQLRKMLPKRAEKRHVVIPDWLIDQIRREEAIERLGIQDRPYTGLRHSVQLPEQQQVAIRRARSFEGKMPEGGELYPESQEDSYDSDDDELDMSDLISPEKKQAILPGMATSTPLPARKTTYATAHRELMYMLDQLEQVEVDKIQRDLRRFQTDRRRLMFDVSSLSATSSPPSGLVQPSE